MQTATQAGPSTLAFKVAGTDLVADGSAEVREDEGIVTAVVSVTGVVDEVDDIIEPGAYRETLSKRLPKVCWHHSWEQPIGRVLHIEELMPGDPRLPTKTRNGAPWPREAGALIATMQFNLKSQRGAEAFEAVRFYSETGECEWSIGYQVPKGKATKDPRGIRHLKAMDLYELSFVLFGAHTLTGTLSLKAAVQVMHEHGARPVTVEDVRATLRRLGLEAKAVSPNPAARAAVDDDDDVLFALEDPGPPAVADAELDAEAEVPPEVAETLPDDPDAVLDEDEERRRRALAAALPRRGQRPTLPAVPDVRLPRVPRAPAAPTPFAPVAPVAPVTAPPPVTAPSLLTGMSTASAAAGTKAMIAALVERGADPWYLALRPPTQQTKRKLTTEQRRRKPTLPGSDTGWPIGDREDLRAAIQAFGRAKPDERDKIKRWITRRARELGALNLLPDSWGVKKDRGTGSGTGTRYDRGGLPSPLEQIKAGGADRNRGNAEQLRRYWTTGAGGAKIRWGTPGDFTRCVRQLREHMGERAKGYCANRHHEMTGMWPGDRDNTGEGKALDTTAADTDEQPSGDDPLHTGVMVALFPDDEAAEQIAVRGGTEPEDLHVTLAYLGDVDDPAGLPGDDRPLVAAMDAIMAAATAAAATHPPLTGRVGGIGKFPPEDDGAVPVWTPVDVPGLGALREAVVDALTAGGLPVKTDHGFTPHMTLGYNLDLSLIPEVAEVPVEFTHLVVAVGDQRANIPLGTDPAAPTASPPPAVDETGKAAAYDPRMETWPATRRVPAGAWEGKGFPQLEGTYEERQQALERALSETLIPDDGDDDHSCHLQINGTWHDRVIVTVHDWGKGADDATTYEVSYQLDPDGTVVLGQPAKVRLTVDAVGLEDEDEPVGDLLPLAEMVEAVVHGFKSLPATQVKVGRVLSAANAQRLKAAVEHLIHVLAAAGVSIDADAAQDGAQPADGPVDTETTAPSARDGRKAANGTAAIMDPRQTEALLAEIAEIAELSG